MVNQEQGALIVQLSQWGTQMGLEEAWGVLWADDFDPNAATIDNVMVSRVLLYGETVGTLTKHGLLDTKLVFDWMAVSGMWARVGPAAMKSREKYGLSNLYENFEALAKAES